MDVFEKYEHAGVTIELHYDDSGIDPRKDSDHAGTILSFTREFDGDEYLSVEDLSITCPSCEGSGENQARYHLERYEDYGWITIGAGSFESMEQELTRIIGRPGYPIVGKGAVRVEATYCPRCEGIGMINVSVGKYLRTIDDAGVVIPLRFSNYVSSASLYETDNNDANAAIYCTAKTLQKECDGDRKKARECLISEVDEMNYYLSGEVYGYVIKDADGNDLPDPFYDSCWGFIGDDKYVREEAERAAKNVAEQLSKEELERLAMAARDIETVGV